MANEDNSQSGEVVARVLGINKDELTRLANENVAVRTGPNKYNLLGTVQGYIQWLRTKDKRAPTQLEVAGHLDMSERNARDVLKSLGIDWTATTIDAVRVAYIRDLREKAAGRGGEEQTAKAKAQTREALASAQLKELQFYKEIKALIPAEEIEPLLESWAVLARSEFQNCVEKLLASIQGMHGIEVKQELVDESLGAAFAAIADYPRNLDGDDVANRGEVEAAT